MSAPARRLESANEPVIPLAIYAAVIFVICWVLSWGPYLQPCACSPDKIRLPFLALAKLIPGVENIRAPGRYAQFFGLPLGLAAVIGARWIAQRLRLAISVLATVLAVVVLIDQMQRVRTYPLAVLHADFFRGAKDVIREGEPIIVLPIAGADHLGTWSLRVQQLEGSTVHWGKLVTGAGSRDTPEQNELISLDANLRRSGDALAEIAAFGRRLGMAKLVIFPGDYPPEVRDRILSQVQNVGGRVLLQNPEGVVISLAP